MQSVAAIRKAKTDSQTTITQKEQAIREATEKRLACQQKETEALAKARTASDSREEMGREMARLAERKAAAESEYDATAAKLWDEYQLTVSQAEEVCVEFDSLPALRAQVVEVRNKIRALGNVNVSAIEEYAEVKARYDALRVQVEDVEGSKNELGRMIANLSAQMREIFTDSFRAINENFGRIFAELFGHVSRGQMLLIHPIRDQFVGDFGSVEQTGRIGLFYFDVPMFHSAESSSIRIGKNNNF